jgi:predicted ferric reductase
VVFVAGGVGINPIVSMLNHLAEVHKLRRDLGFRITLLYTTRDLGVANATEILYLKRLDQNFQTFGRNSEMKLFLTSRDRVPKDRVAVDDLISYDGGAPISVQRRRITEDDLLDALGPVEERSKTVCYVCGFPSMTDEFVEKAQQAEGMDRENVLFEKWW